MESNQFSEFFRNWMVQLETVLGDLLSIPREATHEQEHRALVARVVDLYKTYYATKAAAVHVDKLAFFSPPWLSSLGTAYLWFTGWKPSLAFRLVDSLSQATAPVGRVMGELSEYQVGNLEEVRKKARSEEEKLEGRMERLQMKLGGKGIMELARAEGRARGGGEGIQKVSGMVQAAMKRLMEGLEGLVRSADTVRMKALISVVAILSPIQAVDFLTSAVTMQIQIMRWGMGSSHGTKQD